MNNFAPRLGFAYALNDKTSIRAGAGIFYTAVPRHRVRPHRRRPSTPIRLRPWSLDSGATRNATLSNPYPQGILTLPPGSSQGDRTFLGLRRREPSYAPRTAIREMYSWNFSIQREVGWDSVLEVNYTGSRGVHLYIAVHQPDAARSEVLAGAERAVHAHQLQARVPNPFYGIITDPQATNLNGPTIQPTGCSAICRSMTARAGPSRTPPIPTITRCRSSGRSASPRA